MSTEEFAKSGHLLTIKDMGLIRDGIDSDGLQIFIRNLVMNDKIFGYKTSRIGYILFLTPEDAKNDPQKRIESQYFDKDKLITVDGKLETLRLILKELDEHVKSGPVDFYGDDHYSHLALKFLKKEKFIYDFVRSRSGAFEIFVKESDK